MSNQFSEEYYERLKEEFADENVSLAIDSIQFDEAFKEHLQDLEHFNNHPSLSAYDRNPSLAGQKMIKTYRIKMIQEYLELYDIEANSPEEAIQKLYDAGNIQPDDTKVGESKVKDVFQVINEK